MNKLWVILSFSLLINLNAVSAELSVTLKPTKGISGTHSMSFHEDGKVTLLVYETPSRIVDNLLVIDPKDSEALQQLASVTLNEYLIKQGFAEVQKSPLMLGIAVTQDSVTKSVSSRRLTANAIRLIERVGRYVPEAYRLNID